MAGEPQRWPTEWKLEALELRLVDGEVFGIKLVCLVDGEFGHQVPPYFPAKVLKNKQSLENKRVVEKLFGMSDLRDIKCKGPAR